MSEKRTTARAFHDAVGVEDWRVLFSGAHAYFHVGSFAEAARFVAAIAEVAEVVGHFPDVDVRPEGVTVRTASGEYGALSHRDVELARQISAEAGSCGSSRTPPRSRSWALRWHRMQAATSVRSGPQPSGTGALDRTKTSSIGTDVTRTCRSKASALPSRGVAGPTSTSACRPIRPKQESRQHSKLADAWRTVRMCPIGGHSRRPRTTVSTSRLGRTSRTTRRAEPPLAGALAPHQPMASR